eukprot:scaffold30757_cov33-Tisochrysis_lutea.AAC.1
MMATCGASGGPCSAALVGRRSRGGNLTLGLRIGSTLPSITSFGPCPSCGRTRCTAAALGSGRACLGGQARDTLDGCRRSLARAQELLLLRQLGRELGRQRLVDGAARRHHIRGKRKRQREARDHHTGSGREEAWRKYREGIPVWPSLLGPMTVRERCM